MVRHIPEDLGRQHYQKLGVQERRNLWTRLISERLGISSEEAGRMIARNNRQPEWEVAGTWKVYPRFNANASLLAKISSGYRGPRGPRPIFASLENIARISFDALPMVTYWRRSLGRNWEPVGKQLIDLKLSAANPGSVPGAEFSYNDIRRGVYIPPGVDKNTAGALGIIYSDGILSGEALRLTASSKKSRFYAEVVIPKMEEAFNLLQDNAYEYAQPSGFTGRAYGFLRLSYNSKALATYLVNCHDFRRSEEERRKKGLSNKIKSPGFVKYTDEFLKFYLASASTVMRSSETQSVEIGISDVSGPMLEDVGNFLEQRLEKPSLCVRRRNTADAFTLRMSTVPVLELFFGGMLDENPAVKGEVASYLDDFGIGSRAFKHLYQLYGDDIAHYRRN